MSEQDENDYGGGGCVRTHATNSTSFARCSSQPGNPAYPSMTHSRDNKSQPNGGSGGGLPTLTTASRLDHLPRGNAARREHPAGPRRAAAIFCPRNRSSAENRRPMHGL